MSDVDNETPSKVLFENHQWQVTEYGIESARSAPDYHFDKSRLLEMRGAGRTHPGRPVYDWPVHMAHKSWVDIDAFIEAFTKAIDIHKGSYPGTVDPERLVATCSFARLQAKQ